MNSERRLLAYARQNRQLGKFRPTPQQRRRMLKKLRKERSR